MTSVVLVPDRHGTAVGAQAQLDALAHALPAVDILLAPSVDSIGPIDDGSRRWRGIRRALLAADAVVLLGSALEAGSSRTRPDAPLTHSVRTVALARLYNCPIALVGVGASELRTQDARLAARFIVNCASLLILRDEESAGALNDAKARSPFRVGADVTWTLLDIPTDIRVVHDRVTVVVHERTFRTPGVDQRLASALATCVGRADIRLQPWTSSDHASAARLATELGGVVEMLPSPRTIDHAVRAFLGERLVIGTHASSLMAAASAGVPFVAVGSDLASVGLARRLGQVSIPPTAAAPAIQHAIRVGLEQDPPTRAAVGRERMRAEESLNLLRLLVNGGHLTEPGTLMGLPLASGVNA